MNSANLKAAMPSLFMDNLKFVGELMPAEKVKSLWSQIQPLAAMPEIKAFRLTRMEYRKLVKTMAADKTNLKGASWRSQRQKELDFEELQGFSLPVSSTEYWIIISKGTFQEEEETLMRELISIALDGWQKHTDDGWKEYVR